MSLSYLERAIFIVKFDGIEEIGGNKLFKITVVLGIHKLSF